MNKNKRLIYISLLAAQGVVITMLERAIPFPFAFAPGAKLGLANIITLLAIFTLPYKDSLEGRVDAVVDLDVVGWDVIYLPLQFCGGFFELWRDAFGPAFGSEAGQHDRHQCCRRDSA